MSRLTIQLHVDLTTSRAVQAAIDGVIEGVKNRVIKAAIGKAARIGAKVAKAGAPRGFTGLLKASEGTKYKSYRGGLVWMYAVGARMDGFDGMTPGPRGMRKHRPFKIAHFAESGRKAVQAKPGRFLAFYTLKGRFTKAGKMVRKRKVDRLIFAEQVGPAAGFHFMQHAWNAVKAQEPQIEADILAGIYREAAKYAARGKSIYG